MKILPLLPVCLFACRPFDGALHPVNTSTAVEVFRAVHALDKLGCNVLRITNDGLPVKMFNDLVKSPVSGRMTCGYYDGRTIAWSRIDGRCNDLLHEAAHAMGYDHQTWPPLMWEQPPWLPIEVQAEQFIELTGCKL